MATGISGKNEIVASIAEAVSQLVGLLSSLDENKINSVPYVGSWTAAQLVRHVTKSINGMAKAMLTDAKPAERDPGERIDQLKNIFLDFSKKLNSPEFIIPEEGVYEKQLVIDGLNKAFDEFKKNANSAKPDDLVEGLPLGPITKLEIIHFVLFHTQRHLHQMKKICNALKNK